MKNLLCAAVLCAFLAGMAVSEVQAQAPDRDAVIAVVEAVAALAQAHDLQAMDTLFAPDRGIHIIEGAGVNHGWADYRDNHLARSLKDQRISNIGSTALSRRFAATLLGRHSATTLRWIQSAATWSEKGGEPRCWRSETVAG